VDVRLTFSILLVVACASCAKPAGVDVRFYSSKDYNFSDAERGDIQAIADATAIEVRRLLPALPRDLALRAQPSASVIPETGETGYATLPNSIGWLTAIHADGRRWIGIRAGAYLVDRAVKASGKSAAALVSASTQDIVEMGTVHQR